MADYEFVTNWQFNAPRERVWGLIFDLKDGQPGGAALKELKSSKRVTQNTSAQFIATPGKANFPIV